MMATVSHIGLCVSDLARSQGFYEALGFKKTAAFQVGDIFAGVMELPTPLKLNTVMLEKDGLTIELLQYDAPETLGPASRRPMNQLGFTHLSFRVADVDATAREIAARGGHICAGTKLASAETGDFLYCTDPDGTRIELMRLPG